MVYGLVLIPLRGYGETGISGVHENADHIVKYLEVDDLSALKGRVGDTAEVIPRRCPDIREEEGKDDD
jgi:hypothetical protein